MCVGIGGIMLGVYEQFHLIYSERKVMHPLLVRLLAGLSLPNRLQANRNLAVGRFGIPIERAQGGQGCSTF